MRRLILRKHSVHQDNSKEGIIVNKDRAYQAKGFERPPYHVESFPGYDAAGWHGIFNVNGFNCLRFIDRPGAVFTTDIEEAKAICAKWNGNDMG